MPLIIFHILPSNTECCVLPCVFSEELNPKQRPCFLTRTVQLLEVVRRWRRRIHQWVCSESISASELCTQNRTMVRHLPVTLNSKPGLFPLGNVILVMLACLMCAWLLFAHSDVLCLRRSHTLWHHCSYYLPRYHYEIKCLSSNYAIIA